MGGWESLHMKHQHMLLFSIFSDVFLSANGWSHAGTTPAFLNSYAAQARAKTQESYGPDWALGILMLLYCPGPSKKRINLMRFYSQVPQTLPKYLICLTLRTPRTPASPALSMERGEACEVFGFLPLPNP